MKQYIGIFLFLTAYTTAIAQHSFVSELNSKVFSPDSIKPPYKVIFAGHLYGSQNEELKPYGTFERAINKINLEKPVLFFSLGDAVRKPEMAELDKFSDLTEKIDAPVFTVIGNHEWMDPTTSQRYLGFPFYIIEAPGSAFIILNSEDWNNPEQQEFWDKQLAEYINNLQVKNIFVLSHRLIWATGNPEFADLVSLTNSPEMHSGKQLIDLANLKRHSDKQFYFVSGDLGVNEKLPFFMQRQDNVTLLATGLGDLPTDAVVEATITDNGVEFSALHLSTNAEAQLADYTIGKVAQLVRKNETINAAVQLNNSTTNKAFVVVLFIVLFALGLALLFGKNEI